MYIAWQSHGFPPNVSVNLIELEVGSAGPAAVRPTVSLPGQMRSSPVITFDGRYVAWIVAEPIGGVERVALFDRRTGSTMVAPDVDQVVIRHSLTRVAHEQVEDLVLAV